MLLRASAVVVVAALVGAGLAHGGGSSAEPTVYRFLLDWEQGQYQQAAALTTGQPVLVANELKGAYRQLNATDLVLTMRQVSQRGNSAFADFGASIDLGSNDLQWDYVGHFALREDGSDWRVVWKPSVIEPSLTGQDRLAVVGGSPGRAQLYAASGQPLTVPSATYEIGVTPGRLRGSEVTRTADLLAATVHMSAEQAEQMAGQIEAALPRGFLELVTLSPQQYDPLRNRIAAIAGLQVQEKTQRLFDSIAPAVVGAVGTEVAPILGASGVPYRPGTTVGLSGLEKTFQRELARTPTTEIVVQNAQGVPIESLRVWNGQRAKGIYTTLNYGVQQAANRALAQLPGSAAIVAVQASTGKILAVASHQAGKMPALSPLGGQYQPGQAFTIVSSAALLAAGQVTPASAVQCPAGSQVDGRSFVNIPAEPASLQRKSTFDKDFSLGCATTFAGLSQGLSAGDLTTAAGEFGIGAPWQLPLSGSFSGTIGQPTGMGILAADVVGGGDVRVSPLAMALMAATADSGRWHAPSLVADKTDPSAAAKETMSTQALSELQSLMHDAVLRGSGSPANAGGNVYGQTGSAGFGLRGRLRISWFVGYQGNTAFAVAELVKSPSNSAAAVAGSFLRNIRTGS